MINDVKDTELALSRGLAEAIREAKYRYADDLTYALSVLTEHGIWAIEALNRHGYEGLAKRVNERALNEAAEASTYLVATLSHGTQQPPQCWARWKSTERSIGIN